LRQRECVSGALDRADVLSERALVAAGMLDLYLSFDSHAEVGPALGRLMKAAGDRGSEGELLWAECCAWITALTVEEDDTYLPLALVCNATAWHSFPENTKIGYETAIGLLRAFDYKNAAAVVWSALEREWRDYPRTSLFRLLCACLYGDLGRDAVQRLVDDPDAEAMQQTVARDFLSVERPAWSWERRITEDAMLHEWKSEILSRCTVPWPDCPTAQTSAYPTVS
jgi:hypothetical protein